MRDLRQVRGRARRLAYSARQIAGFNQKYGLGFTLLPDEDHSVAEHYGVWMQKSVYGRKYMGRSAARS
jgi:peroxiredoxin